MPQARLDGPARELKLLVGHRENLVAERTPMENRLRWHLHDLDPERAALLPTRHLEQRRVLDELETELRQRVMRVCPRLLGLPGCGVLTAAKIVAEVAGVGRFRSEAALAMHAGAAPLACSSGAWQRHRLSRMGNRQLNAALHRIAVTQLRVHPPAQAYLLRLQLLHSDLDQARVGASAAPLATRESAA